jgi:hypothetical protein
MKNVTVMERLAMTPPHDLNAADRFAAAKDGPASTTSR